MRKLLIEEDVDVVLSADETFLDFQKTANKVLVSKGVERVGVAHFVNEKNDYLVMITLDMFANIALPPYLFSLAFLVLY